MDVTMARPCNQRAKKKHHSWDRVRKPESNVLDNSRWFNSYPRYVQGDIHLHSVVHHDPTKEGVKIDKQVKVLAFCLLGV